MGTIGSYLYLASRDAKGAKIMFENNEYTMCGRFCEQSVEKSLKAYLEQNGNISDRPLMNLHKPRRLYERCCELGLDILDAELSLKLSVFSEYYYDTNYPGDAYFELTETEAQEALEIMDRIYSMVESSLTSPEF